MVAEMNFVWAYMPTNEPISIDVIEGIGEHRAGSITHRSWLSHIGFVVFALSVFGAAAVVLFVVLDTIRTGS